MIDPPGVPGATWSPRLKLFWGIAAGLVLLAWGIALILAFRAPLPARGDLIQDWASARDHLAGLPLYTDLPASVLRHTGERYDGLLVNAHPPASVLLVLPLAPLPFGQAFRIWNGVWLVVLAPALWALVRERPRVLSPWFLLPLAALLAISRPLEEEISQGQFNLFLLAAITAAWIADRRGRSGLAGALVGAATAVKLIPAFFAVYFAARRQWRALLGAALGFAALNLLALALFGADAFIAFVTEVVPRASVNDESWRNASVRGFFVKLFDSGRLFAVPLVHAPGVARLGPLACSAVVAALVAAAAWRAETRDEQDRAFALCCVGTLLVSPLLWEHYLLLLVLPLVMLWPGAGALRGGRGFLIAVTLVLVLARPAWLWDPAAALLGDFAEIRGKRAARPVHTLTVLSIALYTTVALFVFCWLATRRAGLPAAGEGPPP